MVRVPTAIKQQRAQQQQEASQFEATRQQQLSNLSPLIQQREQQLAAKERLYAQEKGRQDVSAIRKDIIKLQGELTYLRTAQTSVQGGSVVQGDVVNQAGQYSRSTPEYINQRRRVSSSKAIASAKRKALEEEPRRQETITYTDLPAEEVPGYMMVDTERPTTFQTIKMNYQSLKTKVTESKPIQFLSRINQPFGEEYTVIGGSLIKKEDLAQLPQSQQKLLFFAQPESILAFTSYPKLPSTKPIARVKFTGVKQTTEGGKTITKLKFQTSTGERGQAVGVTKPIVTRGNIISGRTDVAGIKGRSVIDLTGREMNMILRDQTKFASIEKGILLKQENQFVQIGGGKISQAKKLTQFKAIDFGTLEKGYTNVAGITGTQKGFVTSLGRIYDLEKITPTSSGIINLGKVGGTGSIQVSSQLQGILARASTEAVVRASIVPAQTLQPVALTGIVSATATTQVTPQLSIQQQVQAPRMLEITKPTQQPITTTIVVPKQIQTPTQQQVPRQTSPQVVVPRSLIIPVQVQPQVVVPKLAQITTQQQRAGTISLAVNISQELPMISEILKPQKQTKVSKQGLFPVLVRRFGKFKIAGIGRTQREAFSIGKQKIGGTLAATFKVKGANAITIPGFKTKKKKGEIFYIEEPKYRLSKASEVKEIQLYKRKKGGRK